MSGSTENYIYYYYDESGVCGMCYNGSEYYYRKNIFGDVIAIYNNLGNLQCRYVYDAWGNHKVYNASGSEIGSEVMNIGNINPIRYRGYYWDKEFNLYYLQSRYYDPLLGRFISADSIDYLEPNNVSGLNLYAYCNNNPIMYVDPSGKWNWNTFWAISAIVATTVLGVALTVASGGIVGAIGAGAALGFATSATSNLVSQVKESGWDNINYDEFWQEGGIGATIGALSGMLSFGFASIASSVGSKVGFAFSQTAHLGSGITFGSVFGTSALMTIGSGIGTVLGSISGAVVGDYIGSAAFGRPYTLTDKLNELIVGEIPGLILEFLEWAL